MIYNNHLTISIYRVHKDYVDFFAYYTGQFIAFYRPFFNQL